MRVFSKFEYCTLIIILILTRRVYAQEMPIVPSDIYRTLLIILIIIIFLLIVWQLIKKLIFYHNSIIISIDGDQHRVKETAYNKILEALPNFRPDVQVPISSISSFAEVDVHSSEIIVKFLINQNENIGEYYPLEKVFVPKDDTQGQIDQLLDKFNERNSAEKI